VGGVEICEQCSAYTAWDIDKYPSSWGTYPQKLAIEEMNQTFKYSTEHSVLLQYGIWAPHYTQVPIK